MDMKPSRVTEEQIIAILREEEAGAATADMCRKYRAHRRARGRRSPSDRLGDQRAAGVFGPWSRSHFSALSDNAAARAGAPRPSSCFTAPDGLKSKWDSVHRRIEKGAFEGIWEFGVHGLVDRKTILPVNCRRSGRHRR